MNFFLNGSRDITLTSRHTHIHNERRMKTIPTWLSLRHWHWC